MVAKGKKVEKKKQKKKSNEKHEKFEHATKEDLELIGNVDDNDLSDIENPDEDYEADPVNRNELRDFIAKLGIEKHRPDINEDDSESEEEDIKEKAQNKKPVDPAHEASKKDSKSGDNKKEKKFDDSKRDKKAKNKKSNETKESTNSGKKDKDGGSVQTEAETPSTSGSNTELSSPRKKTKKEKNKYKSLVQDSEITSTTKDHSQSYRQHMKKYQKRTYLLVKSAADYYDQQDQAGVEVNRLQQDLIKEMEDFASKLLQDETSVYNSQKENAKRSNVGWMKTVLSSGTLSDKIAALTVLVQESPVHSIVHIDNLLSMTRKHVKRESMHAADALKELFLTKLIPDDRKLIPFTQRPLSELYTMVSGNKDSLDKKLVLWYFESQLKHRYSQFIKSLQEMSHNPLLAIRTKSVSIVNQLLMHKPEEEKTLLTLLINKIGDPHYKMASTVTYCLIQLVEKHPNMKEVVVKEVEYVLFRPNISPSAQYYTMCFLNQLKLSRFEKDLAVKLIKTYFSFFRANVNKGEVDVKMMSALLSGVNRAYPYAELEDGYLSEHVDNLYKLVHIVNFGTSVQALSLLYQVMDTSKVVSERYYTALYKKLADPGLKTASKPALFLNLLYKSLKADESDRRRKAFIKRLLQVLFYQQAQFICGSLILISEILKEHPGLLTVSSTEEESDDEEQFIDAPDPDSEGEGVKLEQSERDRQKQLKNMKGTSHKPSSWVHRKNFNHKSEKGAYDPFHRNPLYCQADTECIWELERLTRHYHPSVSLFAKQILKGEHIQYDGNPLQDFTIIRFLDRFVFKNPKKDHGVQKRVATLDRVRYVPMGVKQVSVDSSEFLKMDETKIPVDDVFFHRYFKRKALKKKKKEEEEEFSDVDDAEFDAYLDRFEKNYDEGELTLGYDFASEFEKKTGRKKEDSSSDEDDDDDESMTMGGEDLIEALSDEELDLDDEEMAEAFKDKMEGLLGVDLEDTDEEEEEEVDLDETVGDDDQDNEMDFFDEEDVSFSDDDQDEFSELLSKNKPQKRKNPPTTKADKNNKKGRKHSKSVSALSAAEEFGDLMDENAGSMFDMTGSGAMSTSDKASAKQLKWEIERDRWLRGESWKEKKRKFNKKHGGGRKGFKGKPRRR